MVEPNLPFSHSLLCHIPSMNLGSHRTTNPRTIKGIQRLNHLHPHPTVITRKPCFDHKQTKLGMPSGIHHYPCEILCLLVSHALPQSKPEALGPKPILLLQALLCIPLKLVKGFLSLWEWTLRPPPPQILKSIQQFQSFKIEINIPTYHGIWKRARLGWKPLS